MSPARNWEAATFSTFPVTYAWPGFQFWLSQRVACALPRASAMASAKLAKSTVNHSQIVICRVKPMARAPVMTSLIKNAD